MPVQRAALCIRNSPSQYRNHFRGLSGHKAGRFNATVFISMLSGGRAGVSINNPAAANTSLLASIVRAQTIPSARERCICSGVWRFYPKLLFFVTNKGQWNAKSGPKAAYGNFAMRTKFSGRLETK